MQKDPFHVAGYAVRTTNQQGQAAQDIGALWAKIFHEQLLDKIPNRVDHDFFAVYYDYEGDHTKPYTCLIGVPVTSLNELPEGVTGVSIPEQQYETFTAKGKMPEALGNSWQDIWQKRMDRTYGFDFEHYDEKSFGEHPEVSIWIGVRSSSR